METAPVGPNGEPAGAVFFVPGGGRTTSDVRRSTRDFRKVAIGLPKDAGDPIHGRQRRIVGHEMAHQLCHDKPHSRRMTG